MVLLSLMLSSYYSVAMAWSGLYLGFSFSAELPWTHCNNSWNTAACLQSSLPSSANGAGRADGNDSLASDVVSTQPPELRAITANWSTPGQEFFE